MLERADGKKREVEGFKLDSLKLESFCLSWRVPSEVRKGRGLKLTPFLKSSPPITPFSSFYDDVIGHPDYYDLLRYALISCFGPTA